MVLRNELNILRLACCLQYVEIEYKLKVTCQFLTLFKAAILLPVQAPSFSNMHDRQWCDRHIPTIIWVIQNSQQCWFTLLSST